MRFREIINLLVNILDDLLLKDCIGCKYSLGNQEAHYCLQINKWENFREALEILYESGKISSEEYDVLLKLDNNNE